MFCLDREILSTFCCITGSTAALAMCSAVAGAHRGCKFSLQFIRGLWPTCTPVARYCAGKNVPFVCQNALLEWLHPLSIATLTTTHCFLLEEAELRTQGVQSTFIVPQECSFILIKKNLHASRNQDFFHYVEFSHIVTLLRNTIVVDTGLMVS